MNSKERVDSYIKEAADSIGMSQEDAKELIREAFFIMREIMALPTMPGFTVPGWGKYSVGHGFFRSTMLRMIKAYRKGAISREAAVKVVQLYHPMYKIKWEQYLEHLKKKDYGSKRAS